jgi:hypothetical protein
VERPSCLQGHGYQEEEREGPSSGRGHGPRRKLPAAAECRPPASSPPSPPPVPVHVPGGYLEARLVRAAQGRGLHQAHNPPRLDNSRVHHPYPCTCPTWGTVVGPGRAVKAQGEPTLVVGSTGPTGSTVGTAATFAAEGPEQTGRLRNPLTTNPTSYTRPKSRTQITVRVVLARTFSVRNTKDWSRHPSSARGTKAPDRLVSARTCLRCKEATYRPLTDWRIDSSEGGLLSCRGGSVRSKGSRKPPCRPEVKRSRGWWVVTRS